MGFRRGERRGGRILASKTGGLGRHSGQVGVETVEPALGCSAHSVSGGRATARGGVYAAALGRAAAEARQRLRFVRSGSSGRPIQSAKSTVDKAQMSAMV